jgi:homocysteine S-methyltransferase
MPGACSSVFSQLVLEREVVVIDGGLATELERHGCVLVDPLWSAKVLLENPAAIVRVHRDYLAAGADVIATATYQATFAGLERRGLSFEAACELMLGAVGLAAEARELEGREDAAIAGSVGSYGAFLADGSEYTGDYDLSVEQLVAFHLPRLQLLAPVVDVIACETVPCLAEAEALAICLGELDTEAWVSFSCRSETEVAHGEPLTDCVAALSGTPQVVAIGVNCVSPHWARALVGVVRQATDRAVIAYPNSGEQYRGTWHGEPLPAEAFAELAVGWVEAGATIVGGCCRTTPLHIQSVLRAIASAGQAGRG